MPRNRESQHFLSTLAYTRNLMLFVYRQTSKDLPVPINELLAVGCRAEQTDADEMEKNKSCNSPL